MPVPCENMIGEEGKGFRYILTGMNAERMLIAAECIGDAKWFIQQARDYGCEREVLAANCPKSGNSVPHCPGLFSHALC